MKNLKVPYVRTLDVLDLSSIGYVMEEKAHREFIAEVNWKKYPYLPIVAFDIARGKNDLYIHYFVKGNSLRATVAYDGGPVHLDSCVEFFMQKPGDKHYMNFEFNCRGICDAALRKSKTYKTALSYDEYARIRRYASVKGGPFEEKTGNFSWELIVVIPFEVMGLDPDNLPEKIYGNFYKCADETAYQHYVSWSPIDLPEPNFHCPEFFGEIYL